MDAGAIQHDGFSGHPESSLISYLNSPVEEDICFPTSSMSQFNPSKVFNPSGAMENMPENGPMGCSYPLWSLESYRNVQEVAQDEPTPDIVNESLDYQGSLSSSEINITQQEQEQLGTLLNNGVDSNASQDTVNSRCTCRLCKVEDTCPESNLPSFTKGGFRQLHDNQIV